MAKQARIALSPTAAAQTLPFAPGEARAWLRSRGLVRTFTDKGTGRVREMVLVADIEATIRLDAPAAIDRELGLSPEPEIPARRAPRRAVPYVDPSE